MIFVLEETIKFENNDVVKVYKSTDNKYCKQVWLDGYIEVFEWVA